MTILSTLLGRLGSTVIVLVAAMALLFTLTLIIPGNPAEAILGPRATPEAIAAITHQMGLDRPILERLLRFFTLLLTGDFGTDLISGRPIGTMILEVLPFTLALTAAAILLALVVGVPAGIRSALRPGGLSDQLIAFVSVGFVALPNFVVAIGLLILFSLWLDWLPVDGAGVPGDLGDELKHLVLPALAVALGWVGYLARLIRAAMLEVLGEPYMRTARAFGLDPGRRIWRHALRNAILPVLAVLGVGVGQLLGGAVFAEIIFARPGMGSLIFDAINNRDYPVVQAGVFVIVLLFVASNLAVDALFLWLDPRLRRGSGA